ncbi:DNA cytosine methyltransferase [Helicobacter cetorum]|uniref:DNA cytosine methyltransferase n=1 Tax=Helicobacter cetorum TaxID=138563 RepID=UPI000CF1AC61|nr:DNA cytosine methyltransferase [Helicobacter cetorum]
MVSRLKCASFFAGVGGIELGFKNHINLIYANEFNLNSQKTYEKNFNLNLDTNDIQHLDIEKLPNFDILLAGFPCQAFSIAGYREGFNDKKGRGHLFFTLEKIFKEKQPQIIFLENVKNLVGHDNGKTFATILQSLKNANYFVKYMVLNAMHYGNIPQNRERVYIVCFKDKERYKNFDFPLPLKLSKTISDIVDFDLKVDDKYYYTESNFKNYEMLKSSIIKTNTIYQYRRQYVRENKSQVCPTLTANMGTGGHNVPLVLTKHGIRKLTPKECFLFQGFPKDFKLPQIANSHLYQQAGNSVCVSVIERIANNIFT